MDNIRAAIDTIFTQINSSTILEDLFGRKNLSDLFVTEEMFCQKFMIENKCYTLDQVRELYYLIDTEWMHNPLFQMHDTRKNLFNILLHYSLNVLVEIDGHPVCRYEQLLRWRTLTYKLGEDLFTTSFLAFCDIQKWKKREVFSWSPVILQDNASIDYILRKGVTDLHFHLRGSSLNYDLNWLSLMNNIQNRKADFLQFRKCLSNRVSTKDEEKWDTFYLVTVKSCAIRYYLFLVLTSPSDADRFKTMLFQILKSDNDILIQNIDTKNGSLQQHINTAKYQCGYKIRVNGAIRCIDYAIPTNEEKRLNMAERILSGERNLLYGMFHRIYSGISDNDEKVLFYVYLLQKGRIRKELMQLNDLKGFGNFADYERRKELFIENRDEYQEAIPKLAIDMAFANGCMKYLECRVTPKKTSSELLKNIRILERQIQRKWPLIYEKNEEERKQKYYYILHFIKRKDDTDDNLQNHKNTFILCRHHTLRHDVRLQGTAIMNGLKKYKELQSRIIGVDAANTELYCRPEVFGPIYRYMKRFCNTDCLCSDGQYYSLKFTYHVGEDFWDITDGLRAIDEAILFLNINSSDRLGHALVLGTSVEAYYRFRNLRIIMTKQNILDNAMWLICKAKELNINVSDSVSFELHKIFNEFYDEIYLHSKQDSYDEEDLGTSTNECSRESKLLQQGKDINIYHLSWLLRGDDPECYRFEKRKETYDCYHTLWDITALNHYNENVVQARKNRFALNLYRKYHYDADVRRIGNERYELKLSQGVIDLIEQIQHEMCMHIASMHIGIEANITSNRFIGSFNRYIQHPIVKLYQMGLPTNDKDWICPQMSISVNTDDRGIFDTSIEEEYALLALALEKEKDRNNNPRYQSRYVYEWLNNIRKMGFEQQFKKKDASKY